MKGEFLFDMGDVDSWVRQRGGALLKNYSRGRVQWCLKIFVTLVLFYFEEIYSYELKII